MIALICRRTVVVLIPAWRAIASGQYWPVRHILSVYHPLA
jgi:hypothetical protein